MDELECRGCGSTQPASANFCATCGVPVAAKYIAFGDSDQSDPPASTKAGLSAVLVPLGVAGLLGLLTLALLGAGGDDGDEQARGATIDYDGEASPTPTATASPTATPRPSPTAPPILVDQVVDPSSLPDTEATHLVVAYRSTVHFLDLQTGIWTQTDAGRRLGGGGGPFNGGGTYPFGDGVLIKTEVGGAVSVPLVGEPLVISTGSGTTHLRSVQNDLAFIEDFGAPDRDRHLRVITPTGETAYEIPLDSRMWAAGVTADGQVVIQAGAGVFLASADSNRRLTDGLVSGVIDNLVIVQDCANLDDCSSALVDAATGASTSIVVEGNFFDQGSNGQIVGYGTDGQPRTYELVDNQLVQIASPVESGVLGVGTDADSGVAARVKEERIEFADANGELLASIPFDVENCCSSPFGVTFITADG